MFGEGEWKVWKHGTETTPSEAQVSSDGKLGISRYRCGTSIVGKRHDTEVQPNIAQSVRYKLKSIYANVA